MQSIGRHTKFVNKHFFNKNICGKFFTLFSLSLNILLNKDYLLIIDYTSSNVKGQVRDKALVFYHCLSGRMDSEHRRTTNIKSPVAQNGREFSFFIIILLCVSPFLEAIVLKTI